MINFWKNKRVLITGHTGFKGTWLTLLLIKLGANVYGYSNDRSNFINNYKINFPYKINEKIDNILNLKSLKSYLIKSDPDIIIHMAAQPLVSLSFYRPKETIEVNTLGTLNILETASEIKSLKSLIIVTTDKVYENKSKNFIETDSLGGSDPYSASKAAAEIITNSYKSIYNFRNKKIGLATVRAGNVIGGGDWSIDRLIPDIMKHKFGGQELKIRNKNFTRPWQHVLDPLFGYILLAKMLYKNPIKYSSAWNFGPNHNNKSVSAVVNHYFDIKINNNETNKSKIIESKTLNLNSSKAKKILKWKPEYGFKKSLDITYAWYNKFHTNHKEIYIFTLMQISDFLLRKKIK